MNLNEEYDADEILRGNEENYFEGEIDEESVEELDFESGTTDTYNDLVSDIDDDTDLWE
ncbi:MAG: hypothetical protein GF398_04895 [Chitinivibrionales bacterium]|nr:hypothetical protein [Chitinivibrionales bacterium]